MVRFTPPGRIPSLIKIYAEASGLNVLHREAWTITDRGKSHIRFAPISIDVIRRISVADFFDALPGYSLNRIALNGALLPLGRYNPKWHEIAVRHSLVAVPD